MIRVGSSPYLECSSRGDRRFSAFYARPKSLGGKTIEEAYQAKKYFLDHTTGLSIKGAKGKAGCVNYTECAAAYEQWWKEWIEERGLLPTLREASGLSDTFGQAGRTCQAIVLWKIRNQSQQPAKGGC